MTDVISDSPEFDAPVGETDDTNSETDYSMDEQRRLASLDLARTVDNSRGDINQYLNNAHSIHEYIKSGTMPNEEAQN